MIKIDGIIGLPPGNYVSSHVIEKSMPIAEITPGLPNITKGMTVFKVSPAPAIYRELLNSVGFDRTEKSVNVAFLADSFPTDSFTNEYGESFLQKFTDIASQGVRDIMQATGTESASAGVGKLSEMVKGFGKAGGGTFGSMLEAAGAMGGKIETALHTIESKFGGAKTVGAMLAGARVDFPQLWRNSGFSPSYTMTVRLYNPKPGSKEYTERYIVGPLAVLLCLALPRTKEGNTYSWPFFQKIKAPGIYNLDPAMITNLTVIKGGDQQQISFNQALGIVDVRIDFGSLFNSILAGSKQPNRPTLYSYLKAMKDTLPPIKDFYSTTEKIVGYVKPESTEVSGITSEESQLINNQLGRRRVSASRPPTLIPNRVSNEDKGSYDDLVWW